MRLELSQAFYFEAAHSLSRQFEREGSLRIHGHTYSAELVVAGEPDPATGMLVDLAVMRAAIDDVRERLDHRLLDDVEGLGPGTLENLCVFIAKVVGDRLPSLCEVRVGRDKSGDCCRLRVS